MAALTALQTVTFRDAKGQTATVRYFITSAAGLAANLASASNTIIIALAALSNAAFQGAHGPENSNPLPVTYGASGADYQEVQMKAQLSFSSATGAIHRYLVPAPLVTIFKADRQTVDPANTALAAFTSAFLATYSAGDTRVTDRDGNAITVYLGGLYKARRVSKIRGIPVRDSTLTAGLPAL